MIDNLYFGRPTGELVDEAALKADHYQNLLIAQIEDLLIKASAGEITLTRVTSNFNFVNGNWETTFYYEASDEAALAPTP